MNQDVSTTAAPAGYPGYTDEVSVHYLLYFMKRTYLSIISGFTLGAASWAVVPLVSDRFEPFDSELGFYIGQSILSLVAFYIGFSTGLKYVFIFIIGVYISSNAYPYIFGSSESRAWASLGLITALALCLYPLVFGIAGKIACVGKVKYNNWLKKDAAKRGAT